MTFHQINLIKSSWVLVGTIEPEVVGKIFYDRLFELSPEVRPMFRQPLAEQSKKLLATLSFVISKLDKLDDILHEVVKLAKRHVNYGVKPGHYAVVGDALLWTLETGLGENWNEELKQAWTDCYVILSTAMINAAEYTERDAA
jgi:hemoglobin-like flavoprotein